MISHWLIELGFSLSLMINAALFIPQIISILKNKSAESLSLITFGGFNIIQLFTFLHGIMAKDYILAFGFGLSIITCGMVTYLIIYYKYLKRI